MWSDTARIPRLVGPVDARVAVLTGIWWLHMSWTDFYIAIGSVVFFSALPFFGISIMDVFRWAKQKVSGRFVKSGESVWRYWYRCGL